MSSEESGSPKLQHPTLSRPKPPRMLKHKTSSNDQSELWEILASKQQQGIREELAALKGRDELPDLGGGLGKYMLKRSVMGRKFDEKESQRLISANKTVQETREMLSEGRGNVTTDVDSSGGETTWRTSAGRRMRKALDKVIKPKASQDNPGLTSALTAMMVRSGNCGEHGVIATHLGAQRLETEGRSEESVHMAKSSSIDHGWSELRNKTGDLQQTDILMDAWGEGSAVERSDSAFGQRVNSLFHFKSGKMPTLKFQDLVSKVPETVKETGRKLYQSLKSQDYRSKKIWAPTSVFSKQFLSSSKTAMDELGTVDKLRKAKTDLAASYDLEHTRLMGKNAPARRNLLMDIHKTGVLRSAGTSLKTIRDVVK